MPSKTKGHNKPAKNQPQLELPKKKVAEPRKQVIAQPKQQPAAGKAKVAQARTMPSNQVANVPTASIPVETVGEKTTSQEAKKVVVKWIVRALDMGVPGLRDEYRGLIQYFRSDMTTEAFRANHAAGRNRYQDVPCQDQWRVPLNWPEYPIDYIHANYVSTPQAAKRFICTQGPLDNTIDDFWTMVLQEEATVIVMLCSVVENGKLKCAQYWPADAKAMKLDQLALTIANQGCVPLANEPSIYKTTLKVTYSVQKGSPAERIITHYQWTDWPDRGVPETKLTAMELLSCVRGCKQPIVVHCSAGIGRTGTIVAIEYIMERLAVGEECAAMNELLKMLRDQRAFSIQNDLQYLYVHRVMLAYFLEKHKERHQFILAENDNEAKYAKFIAEYKTATGTNN